jgi:beta-fructofuranosidase
MEDYLVLSGWNATKTLSLDAGEYIWAGNLVNHKLYQLANGELRVTILDQIDQELSNEVLYQIMDTNTDINGTKYLFNKNKGYSYMLFEELEEKPTKILFSVDISSSENFGLTLNAYESVFGDLNVYFNIEENMIEFYKVDSNLISSSMPEITIDYIFGETLDCVFVSEGSVFTIYINGEKALTSRAYNMAESQFGFFTLNSDAVLENVHFYE